MKLRFPIIFGISLAICQPVAATAETNPAGGVIQFTADASDPAAAQIGNIIPDAKQRIEAFFDHPFAEPIRVTLAPNRAAFNAAFPKAWGMTQTECWMVGVGVADFLVVLSPTAWAKEACEHDAKDSVQTREIVTHELVHMYHGQHNPTRDFTGMDDAGWFVEGLAVYVSGQLERGHSSDPAASIREGQAPTSLAKAWSGRYRYGVCGSLVQYIDQTYGRDTIISLLSAASQSEILGKLGLTEAELLSRWKAWVLAASKRN